MPGSPRLLGAFLATLGIGIGIGVATHMALASEDCTAPPPPPPPLACTDTTRVVSIPGTYNEMQKVCSVAIENRDLDRYIECAKESGYGYGHHMQCKDIVFSIYRNTTALTGTCDDLDDNYTRCINPEVSSRRRLQIERTGTNQVALRCPETCEHPEEALLDISREGVPIRPVELAGLYFVSGGAAGQDMIYVDDQFMTTVYPRGFSGWGNQMFYKIEPSTRGFEGGSVLQVNSSFSARFHSTTPGESGTFVTTNMELTHIRIYGNEGRADSYYGHVATAQRSFFYCVVFRESIPRFSSTTRNVSEFDFERFSEFVSNNTNGRYSATPNA